MSAIHFINKPLRFHKRAEQWTFSLLPNSLYIFSSSGGSVGVIYGGEITSCTNSGSVSAKSATSNSYSGGLAGGISDAAALHDSTNKSGSISSSSNSAGVSFQGSLAGVYFSKEGLNGGVYNCCRDEAPEASGLLRIGLAVDGEFRQIHYTPVSCNEHQPPTP